MQTTLFPHWLGTYDIHVAYKNKDATRAVVKKSGRPRAQACGRVKFAVRGTFG